MKKLLLLLGFITLTTTGLANTNSTNATKVEPAAAPAEIPATTPTPNVSTTKNDACEKLNRDIANPSKNATPHIKAINKLQAKELGC